MKMKNTSSDIQKKCAHSVQIGSLFLDSEKRSAYYGGEEICLTESEFSIIFRLLSDHGAVFTRNQLADEIKSANSRTVDVHIAKLRSKLAECDDFEIVTVHGKGYKAIIYI